MNNKESLSHVLWIGGAADSGKSTLARLIAQMKGFQYYCNDQAGAEHLQKLAKTKPQHEKYIQSILDEHWTDYTATEIAEQSLAIARDAFQFVVEDLKGLPNGIPIIAEGVGFAPEIIQPVLTSAYQGIWLVPTPEIMEKSFRKKAAFLEVRMGAQAEAVINTLFQANLLLMETIKAQAKRYGCQIYEIEETYSVEENAARLWAHFSQYLDGCLT